MAEGQLSDRAAGKTSPRSPRACAPTSCRPAPTSRASTSAPRSRSRRASRASGWSPCWTTARPTPTRCWTAATTPPTCRRRRELLATPARRGGGDRRACADGARRPTGPRSPCRARRPASHGRCPGRRRPRPGRRPQRSGCASTRPARHRPRRTRWPPTPAPRTCLPSSTASASGTAAGWASRSPLDRHPQLVTRDQPVVVGVHGVKLGNGQLLARETRPGARPGRSACRPQRAGPSCRATNGRAWGATGMLAVAVVWEGPRRCGGPGLGPDGRVLPPHHRGHGSRMPSHLVNRCWSTACRPKYLLGTGQCDLFIGALHPRPDHEGSPTLARP